MHSENAGVVWKNTNPVADLCNGFPGTVKHLISAVSVFSRFNENDILAIFNFGGHNISWLQIVRKFM